MGRGRIPRNGSDAAYEWFADPGRGRKIRCSLKRATYDYRIWWRDRRPLRWHYFRRQKVSRSRTSRKSLAVWVVVILSLLVVAVTWGGDLVSSVRTLVAEPSGTPGGDSISPAPGDLEAGPKTIDYPYVLCGRPGSIRFDAYRGVNDHLSTQYPASFDDERDYWLQFVDESIQDRYLKRLAENIRAAEALPENQVRARQHGAKIPSTIRSIPQQSIRTTCFAERRLR